MRLVTFKRYEGYQSIPSDLPIYVNEKYTQYNSISIKRVVVALISLVILSVSFFWLSTFHNSDITLASVGDFEEATTPWSTIDPRQLNIRAIERTESSKPGSVFGVWQNNDIPIPTNSWCENFFLGGGNYTDETNKVFQLPYVVEAYAYVRGLRVHPIRVQSNDRSVMMVYDQDNGLALGAVEFMLPHEIAADKNLAFGRSLLSVVFIAVCKLVLGCHLYYNGCLHNSRSHVWAQ
jgi:hypothetical protein